VPTLWATMHFWEADLYDEAHKHTYVNGDGGSLMFRKPGDLYLTATRPGMEVLNLGSNGDTFWVQAAKDTLWWGRYKNLGLQCAKEIPIRPDLLIEVLGISEFNTDLMQAPVPTMRFNNDADAYMFTWHVPSPSLPRRWITEKEVWYDRKSHLPTAVLLFDEDGRILLRAYLSDHKPVEGTEKDHPAQVATKYSLFFPPSGSRFNFQLEEDIYLQYNKRPADVNFRFDSEKSNAVKKIQIDENCRP
jgi:hypothetical protein